MAGDRKPKPVFSSAKSNKKSLKQRVEDPDSDSDSNDNNNKKKSSTSKGKKKVTGTEVKDLQPQQATYSATVLQDLKTAAKKRAKAYPGVMVVESDFHTNNQLTAGYLGFHTVSDLRKWVKSESKHSILY